MESAVLFYGVYCTLGFSRLYSQLKSVILLDGFDSTLVLGWSLLYSWLDSTVLLAGFLGTIDYWWYS